MGIPMDPFYIARDGNGSTIGCVNPSPHRNHYILAAGVAKTVYVPSGAKRCVFSTTLTDMYVDYDTPAATPTSDIINGTAPELNPIERYLNGVTTISLISATGGNVNISFWG